VGLLQVLSLVPGRRFLLSSHIVGIATQTLKELFDMVEGVFRLIEHRHTLNDFLESRRKYLL